MLTNELLATQAAVISAEDGADIDLYSATEHPEDVADSVVSQLDAESLFAADLAATSVLTRAEEAALTRQIAHARRRVRAILRKAHRLARAALADSGRGVIAPEEDFRERETVTILNYARQALQKPRTARTTGLGRKQLREFVKDLSAALADYRKLRDQMVRANVRLVNVLARRYRHPSVSVLDLFQEGTIGLLRAVEKYDPQRNVKFSTYATWWIRQQLGRAGDTQGALIRTPVHWNQFRRRLSRDQQELAAENDGCASREDLALMNGMDTARLEMMGQSFHFVSTDAPVSDGDDRPLESTIAAETIEPEDQALKTALRDRLELALTKLPARESLILRQRFGLADDTSETLEELGTRLGVSRERVRQLESRALKQLRGVCTAEGLQDYLH